MAETGQPKPILYVGDGGGSMLAEIALTLAGLAYQVEPVIWGDQGLEHPGLAAANPLAQVPTLVYPDGRILTETAAILVAVDDARPDLGLIPARGHPKRDSFWRWLMVINAAIYPTFTYGDYPQKWADQDTQGALRARTDAHRENLMRHLEAAAHAPWFLGNTMSGLDLYIWMLVQWRPRPDWYATHAPKLMAIAKQLQALPVTQAVMARNHVPGVA